MLKEESVASFFSFFFFGIAASRMLERTDHRYFLSTLKVQLKVEA